MSSPGVRTGKIMSVTTLGLSALNSLHSFAAAKSFLGTLMGSRNQASTPQSDTSSSSKQTLLAPDGESPSDTYSPKSALSDVDASSPATPSQSTSSYSSWISVDDGSEWQRPASPSDVAQAAPSASPNAVPDTGSGDTATAPLQNVHQQRMKEFSEALAVFQFDGDGSGTKSSMSDFASGGASLASALAAYAAVLEF